jgi:hypothetical protein
LIQQEENLLSAMSLPIILPRFHVMNKPSDSILILGNLEAMRAILRSVEHRFHALGHNERARLEPAIQKMKRSLDQATHALIEILGPDEQWNIKE